MLVYRIENVDGLGPYAAYAGITKNHPVFGDRSAATKRRPAPETEFGRSLPGSYYFGCMTEHALAKWFAPYLGRLAELEFHFVVLDAKQLVLGKTQVAFNGDETDTLISIPVRQWSYYAKPQ